jgi:hypothetical protein
MGTLTYSEDQKAPSQLWCSPGLVLEKNPRTMADCCKSHFEWRRVPWRCGRSSSWEVGNQDLIFLGGVRYSAVMRDPQGGGGGGDSGEGPV